MLGRTPRPITDVLNDAHIVYQVGKLIGAAEVAAYYMTLNEDEEIQKMGERLGEIVGWFFMPDAELGERNATPN